MKDGLKDKHRQSLIDIFAANEHVERVVLFGSRAKVTFTLTSDVDIVLYGDDLTLTDHANLLEAIDALSIPQQVDILLHKSITSPKLLKQIEKHGVEWYKKALPKPGEPI